MGTHSLQRTQIFSLILLFLLTVLGYEILHTQSTAAQALPCTGAHLATTQEAASANPAGSIVAGKTYVCPNDSRLGVSNDAGSAKQFLRGILCKADSDNYGGVGPDETINGLDNKFAVCAAAFLKAMQSKGENVCVKEGKRSVEKQNAYVARGVIACKKGAACEHPRGIAIDVNVLGKPSSCSSYQPLHQAAPSFGLTFYMGCKDAVHFVPQKSGCTAGGTAPANSDLPSSSYDFPQYAPQGSSAAPQMPGAQGGQQGGSGSSSGGQSPTSQPSPTTPPTTPTPLTSSSTSNTLLASLMSGSGLNATPASSIVSSLFNALSPSAAQAAPATQNGDTIGVPIALNGDISNVVTIVPGNQEGGTVPIDGALGNTSGLAGNTFTSSDLQTYSANGAAGTSFASTIQSTLVSIKSALSWITSKVSALL